ncbi:TPA: ead/Ea22-like family protein [Klebsiella pneumoniae]|nr:ead/Ea22-like family protein [Klebsiella pneumoniae]HEF8915077.1 ead/Ea22-like family protein [Klebsiella pneumoniae]HEF8941558.1 ead/Ea22-like family protein [Klebsiella pneumoniae]HEG3573720.1 ead/Ea22-like family protein [Klebsiella pneumoniae]HEG4253044.1 ead/Ea22-like family protein [Klebsiella pneumoniae]
MWDCWKEAGAELVEALEKSEKTSEARREAIDRTHNMFVRERDRANAAEEALEKAQQHIARQEQILLNQDESLSIRRGELEAAQQERESWRTSFDNERFRADKLKAHIDDIEPVRAAAEKLVRCKGRYHSELNYRALAALFGVTTPDLPPLEHENVHYADAADMEIAALRQRIAELESRTVTVKLPQAVSAGGQGYQAQVERILTAAGIKVEAE